MAGFPLRSTCMAVRIFIEMLDHAGLFVGAWNVLHRLAIAIRNDPPPQAAELSPWDQTCRL